MSYSSVFWLPLCAALTALGLVVTYTVGRRRGHRAMLRGVAWSLIPIAAYLTGSIKMFWQIGDAIGNFASGFVFSPVKWAGIGVAGLIAVLFLATAGRERRKAARAKSASRAAEKAGKADATAAPAQAGLGAGGTVALPTATMPAARQPEPARQAPAAKGSRKAAAPPLDDDMKDIEDILRKRGL
ncbi:MAG TPA: cellulose synthase [Trebonia sp.]|nr:cellulose synthase [Trebonia sp.]